MNSSIRSLHLTNSARIAVRFLFFLLLYLCFFPALPAQEQDTSFLPKPEDQPLKIRINLIILQREDGTGNFQDSAADHVFLYNMMQVTNAVYADIRNRSEEYYPGQGLAYIPNAKVEFVPHIIFHRDERGWNNRNDRNFAGVPNLSGWYLGALDSLIYGNDSLPKAINLYFTTDGQLYEQMVVQKTTTDYNTLVFFKQHAASEIPFIAAENKAYGSYHSMRAHIGNVWLKLWWKRHVLKEPDWTMEQEVGKSIAHELGHLMGLSHTSDVQLHALMRTRFGGWRDYLSPGEISSIHKAFAFYPSLWQYLPEDFTYQGPAAEHMVQKDETWNRSRRLYANLRIKTGTTLIVTSELLLPPSGDIILESGATLLVKGGLIRRINSAPPVALEFDPRFPEAFRLPLSSGGIILLENGKLEQALLR